MPIPWELRFADRTHQMKSSAIREMLKLTEHPDIISFGGGLPAPEAFPLEEFRAACNTVLERLGPQALQYGTTEGYRPLREMLAYQTTHLGLAVTEENLLITSGSQQALDLLGRVFINPGDTIVVESPTYSGALQAWSACGPHYACVPADENGMLTDDLESALRLNPKFIYVLPNFQNPSGTTLSLERRRECHLPEHILQDLGAGHPPGVGSRAGARDPQAGAGQTGRRPEHRCVQPDGGPRGRPGRLSG